MERYGVPDFCHMAHLGADKRQGGHAMFQVRLINEPNERACTQRNALTIRPTAIALNAGTVGIVLEVFDGGDALLVEFGSRGNDRCYWLGVLHATEVERVAYAQAA
jgi:hypothetical protein